MILDLHFPSDPRLLHIVRSVVGQFSAQCGFQEDEVQFIILAVDEACANIIRHAYGGRTDGEIRLSCRSRDDRLEFILVDHGLAPLPELLQSRPLEEIRPGGLGLHLIRSVMDEVRFRFDSNENELYLAKSLRPDERMQKRAVTE